MWLEHSAQELFTILAAIPVQSPRLLPGGHRGAVTLAPTLPQVSIWGWEG